MGIITNAKQPTQLVSNIVVIDNPNKLRICIDLRPLNDATKIPHYTIPSSGKYCFLTFNAKNGFWQLALDEESSYLTTFSNSWGRYQFLVLPFGLNNSPEEFQKTMEEMFQNEPNVIPYFEDICIGSKTMEEHCQTLRKVLNIARANNLKFNPLKTQLAKSSLTYLGHKISGKGIEPDSKKIESIEKCPTPPQNEQELQRFLGKQIMIADTFPRAQLNDKLFNDDNFYESPAALCLLATTSSTRWEELAKLTKDDPELDYVVYRIKNGLPDKINTRKYSKQFW
ncbi:Retrovirus-related Pol polyprotein from transposon 17.6 [Araneus ventricosus]|uniref:Retrovirus-related Pol polyprotein from transposon 17.6 n=1 Tax=Araneus ventricosus TaxID=182803 RepID=A0A4Y2L3T7_ARAVE|nr:Retrovirus-related Pol polyprotein from transposon 17.6 [Araneus ventricosus]